MSITENLTITEIYNVAWNILDVVWTLQYNSSFENLKSWRKILWSLKSIEIWISLAILMASIFRNLLCQNVDLNELYV